MNLRRHWPILLPWFALLGWAICLAAVWHALPARLAVHFAADGSPNGWADRGSFAALMLVLWASLAGAFSALLTARPQYRSVLLPAHYFVAVAFVVTGLETLLANLGHPGISLGPYVIFIGVPALILWNVLRPRLVR